MQTAVLSGTNTAAQEASEVELLTTSTVTSSPRNKTLAVKERQTMKTRIRAAAHPAHTAQEEGDLAPDSRRCTGTTGSPPQTEFA